MNSFAKQKEEEEDTRSIKIRNEYKPLIQYLERLESKDMFFPHEETDIFDDIFRSFLKEHNYDICLRVLQLLFQKIDYYALEKANCKMAFNIGRVLDYFLTNFKTNITDDDLRSLHAVITTLASAEPLNLRNLRDTNYVMAVVYLKHYSPDLYDREKNEILLRLHNNELIDSCIKKIGSYPIQQLNDLIYFQLRSFVLIRNTKLITKRYIDETIEKLSDGDYRADWITIFANKMLATLIVPIISCKETNSNDIQIDDEVLLEWLLIFSERALGQKVQEDKWESINDEEFALTWTYVKKHATSKQRKNFQRYLIDNGFEFHLGDPFSGTCFPSVNTN